MLRVEHILKFYKNTTNKDIWVQYKIKRRVVFWPANYLFQKKKIYSIEFSVAIKSGSITIILSPGSHGSKLYLVGLEIGVVD